MTSQSRRRSGRRNRVSGSITQSPWKTPRYHRPPYALLSEDALENIHRAGLSILQETGMTILSDNARTRYAAAGFDVDADSQRVRFDSELLEALISSAPSSFTLQARNPAKNLRIGDGHAVFTSVGGPAYVMDRDKGRRNGSYAEMCDFLRLVQSLDILHQDGGGGFEAMDLPAPSRHLDLFYAQCTLLDKNWVPWTMGREQTLDAIQMMATSLGKTPQDLVESPALCGIINTNTPLQLDIPMAEGLITMAEHGQASAITPFTLSGAMAPVTLAGALALQHAEAMAGIVLTQVVRPGAPVLYGGFTSNVDMKTGSPAFGTPEYLQAAQASGQLARRLGVPLRSSNVNAANCPDAQAAYESCLSLWGAISGQASMIKHAAGWLHGGLTASLEKLVIDAEIIGMAKRLIAGVEVRDEPIALELMQKMGHRGDYLGQRHTLKWFQAEQYIPSEIIDRGSLEAWKKKGSKSAWERAQDRVAALLDTYESPPIADDVRSELRALTLKAAQTFGMDELPPLPKD